MLVVIYTYSHSWQFIRSYEGMSESEVIAKISADGFKGWAVLQGEKKTVYEFK